MHIDALDTVSPGILDAVPLASLNTVPQIAARDAQAVCADAGAANTDASGTSAAASAAALMCFEGPSINCCDCSCS